MTRIPNQFDKLRTELMEEYDPQSAVECELVERLSSLLWRLRRIPAFEAAIIDARRAEVDDPLKWLELGREERLTKETIKVRILGHALVQDAAYHDTLGKLARHETTLMHAFAKTLQMLLLLCNRRSNRGDGLIIEPISLPPKA